VEVRVAAIEALGRIGDVRAAGPLIDLLFGQTGELRQAADKAVLEVIQKLEPGDSALRVLSRTVQLAQSPHLVLASVVKLKEIPSIDRIPLLIKALESTDEHVQIAAIETLRMTADLRALQAMLQVMQRCDAGLKGLVGDAALRLVRDTCRQVPSNLPLLKHALAASQIEVAIEAARVLGIIRDPQASPALFQACLRGNAALSSEAGKALFHIHDARVTEDFGRLLRDGDDRMAAGGFYALAAIGRRSVPILKRALKWQYVRARYLAVLALGRIGDPSVIADLRSATNDRDRKVADAARGALKALMKKAAP
jgi:HEAT repeat protein